MRVGDERAHYLVPPLARNTQRRYTETMTAAPRKHSAGLLLYRDGATGLEFFLVHPGGPFFARKDAGAWSIPKGELDPSEAPLACAIREFEEEIGVRPDARDYLALGSVTQRGGKVVHAWAFTGLEPPPEPRSNEFEIEWPPRSGRRQRFPEIDRAGFFPLEPALAKLNPAQHPFVDRLRALLTQAAR